MKNPPEIPEEPEFVRVNPESPVNLVGATFDVIESKSAGGKTITLKFSIENRGSIGTSGFDVSFYLSGNKLINNEKEFLTNVTMPGIEAGGVSSLNSLNINLPAEILKAGVPLDDGVFYIGMVIDPRNNVDESNEKDNSSLGRGRDYDSITILDSASVRPIKFDAHHIGHDGEAFSPGDRIVIDWQLQNFGYGNAADFFLKFLIDFPVASELGDGFLGKKLLSLKSGEITSGSFQGTMPPDGSLVYKFKGNTTYRIDPDIEPFTVEWFALDTQKLVGEEILWDEVKMVEIPAHLINTELVIDRLDKSFAPGDPLPVSFQFWNRSPVKVSETFRVGLVISRDDKIDPNEDFVFATFPIEGINAETIYFDTVSPLLPSQENPFWIEGTQTYYLGTIIDIDGVVNEDTHEDNIIPQLFVRKFMVTKNSDSMATPFTVGAGAIAGIGTQNDPLIVAPGTTIERIETSAGSAIHLLIPVVAEGQAIEVALENEFGSGTLYVSFDNFANSSEFDFKATFNGPIDPARIVFSPPDNRQVRMLIQSETAISGGRFSISPGAGANRVIRRISKTRIAIEVLPKSDVAAYAVEESIPVGFSVDSIGGSGDFDANSSKIKWGPFFDNQPRTLTYELVAPGGSNGKFSLAGLASFDGLDVVVTGDLEIQIGSAAGGGNNSGTAERTVSGLNVTLEIQPAASTGVYAIEESLPTGFTADAVSGNGAFDANSSKIKWGPFFDNQARLVGYSLVSPASFNGLVALEGIASFDGQDVAIKGDLQIQVGEPGTGASDSSPVRRHLVANGNIVTVNLDVNPVASTFAQAIQESVPAGFTVSGLNEGGVFDTNSSKIKWGPYFDNSARTLDYVLTAASDFTGVVSFSGVGSFDGVDIPVTGVGSIELEADSTDAPFSIDSSTFEVVTVGGGQFLALTVNGTPGRTYQAYVKNSLSASEWKKTGPPQVAGSGPLTLFVTAPGAASVFLIVAETP